MKIAAAGEAVSEHKRDYRRAYRKAKALWHYRMVRLDHDDARALRDLAKRKRTTVAELMRTFVAWGLEDEYGGADAD
jgi:hypothetical protein